MSFRKKFNSKNPIRQNNPGEEKVKKLRKELRSNYNMPLSPEDKYPDVELTDDMFSPSQDAVRKWNKARYETGRYDDQLGDGNLKRQEINLASTRTLKHPDEYYEEFYEVVKNAKGYEDLKGLIAKGNDNPLGIDNFEYVKKEWKSPWDVKNFHDNYFKAKEKWYSWALPGGSGPNAGIAGVYKPGTHTTFTKPLSFLDKLNPSKQSMFSTQKHEAAHAANASPQDDKITEITGFIQPKTIEKDIEQGGYYNRANEIYARLMAFRLDNNIDPNRIWTMEDIPELNDKMRGFDNLRTIGQKWKERDNLLSPGGKEYIQVGKPLSDKDLLRLLNEVAANSPEETWQEEMQRKNNMT